MTDEPSSLGDPDNPLRHRAFFRAASQYPEGSPESRAAVAGLLVVRYLDKFPTPTGRTAEEKEGRKATFRPVRRAVEAMDDAPIKRVLLSLTAAILAFSRGRPDSRLGHLIAYAQFLEDAESWEPGADAYVTATELIKASERNADLLPMCYDRAAHCLRQAGEMVRAHELLSAGIETANNQRATAGDRKEDEGVSSADYWSQRMQVAIATLSGEMLEQGKAWEDAAVIYSGAIDLINRLQPADRQQLPRWYERAAYCLRQIGKIMRAREMLNDGIELARELEDQRTAMYLRISDAVVERQTGDLQHAEFQLNAIMEEAGNAGEQELLARSTHERGVVAYYRQQHVQAAGFFREAAGLYKDQRMVRRALTDLAMSLGELGHHDYAAKVYRAVYRAPDTESEPRHVAGLNLLRSAFLAGDRAAFDQLRDELDHEHMSGRLQSHYWLFVGQGLLHFKEISAARRAFEKAIRLAEQYAVRTLLTEAKALLSAMDDRPIPWREPEESPMLIALFAEIDEAHGMFAGAIAA